MGKSNLSKFKSLLAELFMFDQADLDFGIYRIMNAKRDEITRFLDNDLLPQVRQSLAQLASGDRAQLENELAKAIESLRELGSDPESSSKVKELREQLAEHTDIDAIESEVFSHLYEFFRRYYSEGDFLSLRRYKAGVYAIPYEGEEVKLHWANADQYYIKTTENFRDYTFTLPDGRRVHFKVVKADTQANNNKATNGQDRRFILASDDPITDEHGDLVIHFQYRPDDQKRKQIELNNQTLERILSDKDTLSWVTALQSKNPTEKNPSRTLIDKHLTEYTARNTFDYFIHKDLGTFLRRELDFYIKNEVMYLDDIESDAAPHVERYLAKVKAMRRIAHKIIDFLSQLEEFQKKLWLKKKFVIESNYCLTLDRVPEQLYSEIAANDAQRQEWVQLFSIDQLKKDLTGHVPYSEPLTVDFLKENQFLVLDTKFFSDQFKNTLLAKIDDIDRSCEGLLVRSENFQALRLIGARYRGRISCIYIDPPYNTGDSEILYKNEYISSSWLTLMENRIALVTSLFSEDPVLFIAIDDFEMVDLCELLDRHFSMLRREMIVINHHPQGGKAKVLANTHEYMLACVAKGSDRTLSGRLSKEGTEYRPFKRSGTAESNFRSGRPNSFYAILVEPTSKVVVAIEKPPAIGDKYPTSPTGEGYLRIYPLGTQGQERVWRRSYESCLRLISTKKLHCSDNLTIYQLIEAEERTPALFSNWVDPRYNAGTFGANLLRDIMGAQNPFSYPKSIFTVEDALFAAGVEDEDICLDFFAGSGTTGHAVVNFNRADGGSRRFILVEMGDYFDTVLVQRIKKVIYSKEWNGGRPVSREGVSQMFKYIRLESYEDALTSIEVARTSGQADLISRHKDFREDYLLRYMLDTESRNSASLLNCIEIVDPFNYALNVRNQSLGEMEQAKVDLVETFNYLLGLHVKRIDFISGFKIVEGANPDGEKVLVIWRNTQEKSNSELDAFFKKQAYKTSDTEFDLIYVNGDNNLENLRRPDETWKVRMIEREFPRLMFDS